MKLTRPAFWSEKTIISYVLWPVSLLFRVLAFVRRAAFKSGFKHSWRCPVPVVVIGNITVGGAGKTPLVIALSELLTQQGYKAGIVTRGYGGKADAPVIATADSDAAIVGDEPVLLARRTAMPVVVSRNRVAAVKYLLSQYEIDCVLCDDGLQHYALARDLEIAVVDSTYRFGNRFCLPAGPLREPVKRLDSVDITVFSGGNRTESGYTLVGTEIVSIADDSQRQSLANFSGSTVHAIAGIATPDNFFKFLHEKNINTIQHSFEDHAVFNQIDLDFNDGLPIVMTEKDMVKCTGFDLPNIWYLPVTACLDKQVADELLSRIETLITERKSNAA